MQKFVTTLSTPAERAHAAALQTDAARTRTQAQRSPHSTHNSGLAAHRLEGGEPPGLAWPQLLRTVARTVRPVPEHEPLCCPGQRLLQHAGHPPGLVRVLSAEKVDGSVIREPAAGWRKELSSACARLRHRRPLCRRRRVGVRKALYPVRALTWVRSNTCATDPGAE